MEKQEKDVVKRSARIGNNVFKNICFPYELIKRVGTFKIGPVDSPVFPAGDKVCHKVCHFVTFSPEKNVTNTGIRSERRTFRSIFHIENKKDT